jgi:hypothetical protein
MQIVIGCSIGLAGGYYFLRNCLRSHYYGPKKALGDLSLSLEQLAATHHIFKHKLSREFTKYRKPEYSVKWLSSCSFQILFSSQTEKKGPISRKIRLCYRVEVTRFSFIVSRQDRIYETDSIIPLELLKFAYKRFQKMKCAGFRTSDHIRLMDKIHLTSDFNLRWWSERAFLINQRRQSPIGQGSFKKVKSVTKVDAFIRSKAVFLTTQEMVRVIPMKSNKIAFLNPIFSGLEHPNILIPKKKDVRIHSKKNIQIFLTQKADSDLDIFMRNARATRLSEGNFYWICLEILKAMDYLHKNNIVHGDVKPANILVFRTNCLTPSIKITDLDSARRVPMEASSKMPIQTITFLPLEIRRQVLLSSGKLISQISNSEYANLWRVSHFSYRLTPASERCSIGLVLAWLYYIYHNNMLPIMPSERQNSFEDVIQALCGYNIRPFSTNINSFLENIDIDLKKRSARDIKILTESSTNLFVVITWLKRFWV